MDELKSRVDNSNAGYGDNHIPTYTNPSDQIARVLQLTDKSEIARILAEIKRLYPTALKSPTTLQRILADWDKKTSSPLRVIIEVG